MLGKIIYQKNYIDLQLYCRCYEVVETPRQEEVLHIGYITEIVVYVVIDSNRNVEHGIRDEIICTMLAHT